MTDDNTVPKVRLVKCPRCHNLLPEPEGVPIYSCGGCGAYLLAKNRKSNGAARATKQFEAVSSSPQESDRLGSSNEIAASEEDSSNTDTGFLEEEKETKENSSEKGAGTGSRVVALGSDPNVINETREEEEKEAAEEGDSDSNQTLKIENQAVAVDRDSAKTKTAEEEDNSWSQCSDSGNKDNEPASGERKDDFHEEEKEDEEEERRGEEEEETEHVGFNRSMEIEEDTADLDDISVPHSEPEIEEKGIHEDEAEAEAEAEAAAADNVGSSQCSNVCAEETVRERACQETAMIPSQNQEQQFEESTSFAMEQFQNLDTYFGAESQEPNKIRVVDVYGEETFDISEEEKKLRKELLMLNQTPSDSVSEMLMIKGLDPVTVRGRSHSHPTRYRTRSEIYDHELQWGPRYGEGPSNQEPYNSDYYPPQDKAELLRIMVLQLEEQVRKMRDSGCYTSEAENNSVETNRFYSGMLNRPRNQFSQYQSSGFSSPQPRRYYSPSPTWDLETKSDDQLSNNSKFSYQRERRVHVPKRHIRPVAGGSPMITCCRCSVVLQLPEDFLLSKRKRCHWLKCGSCSTVLRFSLQNGTHIVPYRESGGPENGKKETTEAARRRRGSALHKLMGYSSVTQLVIGSGESSPF